MRFPADDRCTNGRTAEIYAAACTGSVALSSQLDLPLVHIGVSEDIGLSLRRLNDTRHGCGVLWPQSLQPIKTEDGWDDWRLFSLEPPEDDADLPCAASFDQGRIMMPLPANVSVAEFAEQLAGALRHLRFDAISRTPAWLQARSIAQKDVLVHPRYTLADRQDYRQGASLVTDVYAFDPTEDGARLLWFGVAAKAAAAGSRLPRWR